MKIIWNVQGCRKKKNHARSKHLGCFLPDSVLGERRSEGGENRSPAGSLPARGM